MSVTSASRSRSRAGLAIVIAMAAVAFVSRLRGIDWLLPQTHLDGSVIVHQIEKLRDSDGDFDAVLREDGRFRYYPLLLARAAALLPDPTPADPAAESTEAHVRRATATWRQARGTAAFLGLLLVPLTFLLARRFLDGPWPVLAAGFVATSLLLATFGTMARPHAPAGAAILAAVLAAMRLRERGDVTSHLLVGVAGGLALGGLHYGAFAGPPILLAWCWRRRAASGLWLVPAAAIVAALVVWFYPFHFVPGHGFLSLGEAETGTTLNLSGQALHFGLFNGAGFGVIPETMWSYDPVLLFAALLGAAALITRRSRGGTPAADDSARRRDLAILLTHAVPYAVVIGLYQNTWERFVIQLLPYFAVLGAYGVSRVAARDGGRSGAARAAWVIAPLVLPALLCWRLGTVRQQPDTYDLAAAWVRDEMPKGTRLALAKFEDLPLFRTPPELRRNRKAKWASAWLRYESRLPEEERRRHPRHRFLLPVGRPHELVERYRDDPLGYLAEVEADWVLIPVDPPGELPHIEALRDAVRARGDAVFAATPARDGSRDPAPLPNLRITYAEWSRPFVRRLLRTERLGPTLEIHAVDP